MQNCHQISIAATKHRCFTSSFLHMTPPRYCGSPLLCKCTYIAFLKLGMGFWPMPETYVFFVFQTWRGYKSRETRRQKHSRPKEEGRFRNGKQTQTQGKPNKTNPDATHMYARPQPNINSSTHRTKHRCLMRSCLHMTPTSNCGAPLLLSSQITVCGI